MQIVRTIIWVLILVGVLLFSFFNWREVEVTIWDNLVLETKVPALIQAKRPAEAKALLQLRRCSCCAAAAARLMLAPASLIHSLACFGSNLAISRCMTCATGPFWDQGFESVKRFLCSPLSSGERLAWYNS